MPKEINATDLFKHPTPSHHNSEAWWTSLFSILLLHLGNEGQGMIPIMKYSSGPPWSFSRAGFLDCSNLRFSSVLVETSVNAGLFDLGDWPPECEGKKPDILLLDKLQKKATIIEVKTVSATVGEDTLKTYLKVRDHLRQNKWSADLYFLLSLGHEGKDDYELIERKADVILWEDILPILDKRDHFKSLFDVDLRPYYETPQRQQRL